MPATISPAGGNINAAPILVNSIKEIMSMLANVDLFIVAFRNFGIDLSHFMNFGISPTVAHGCGLLYEEET